MLEAQDFEGIIQYQRVKPDGNLIVEDYRLKENRIRLDLTNYSDDSAEKYTYIYRLDESPNVVYEKKHGDDSFTRRPCKPDNRTSFNDLEYKKQIGSWDTEVFEIEYHNDFFSPFESTTTQKVWIASDIRFTFPETWHCSPYMLLHNENGIVLKMEEKSSSSGASGYSYTRELHKLEPKEIDEHYFLVE